MRLCRCKTMVNPLFCTVECAILELTYLGIITTGLYPRYKPVVCAILLNVLSASDVFVKFFFR